MKKTLTLLFIVILSVQIDAAVRVDRLIYELNTKKHTASIVPAEEYEDLQEEIELTPFDTLVIPDFIKYKGKKYRVTHVQEYAMTHLSEIPIKTLVVGKNIEYIPEEGLIGLDSVTTVLWNAISSGGLPFATWVDDNPPLCLHIREFIIGSDVKSLPSYICSGMRIREITIPKNIRYIPVGAFFNCIHLRQVNWHDGIQEIQSEAFLGCTSLTTLTIPESVKLIESDAFLHVPTIQYSKYPYKMSAYAMYTPTETGYSVTELDDMYDIEGCNWGNQTLNCYVDSPLIYVDPCKRGIVACMPSAKGEVVIPDSVINIGPYAFEDCELVYSVTVPQNVEYVGTLAFHKVVNIHYNGHLEGAPWGAKCVHGYIEGHLIYTDSTRRTLVNCMPSATGDIELAPETEHIMANAFDGCDEITSIRIPENVRSVSEKMFQECSALTTIYWDAKHCEDISVDESSWSRRRERTRSYSGKPAPLTFVIGKKVEHIPAYLCENTRVSEIKWSESVTSVGTKAFRKCYFMDQVEIGEHIHAIGEDAFMGVGDVIYHGEDRYAPWGAKKLNGETISY